MYFSPGLTFIYIYNIYICITVQDTSIVVLPILSQNCLLRVSVNFFVTKLPPQSICEFFLFTYIHSLTFKEVENQKKIVNIFTLQLWTISTTKLTLKKSQILIFFVRKKKHFYCNFPRNQFFSWPSRKIVQHCPIWIFFACRRHKFFCIFSTLVKFLNFFRMQRVFLSPAFFLPSGVFLQAEKKETAFNVISHFSWFLAACPLIP